MRNLALPFVATAFAASFFCSCSESDKTTVAGGISEETNSVAGVLTDLKSNPVKGVAVLARHTSVDTLQFTDTTSEKGEFAFPIVRQGTYGLSASVDSAAYYALINYEGEALDIEAELRLVADVAESVVLSEDADLNGIEVFVPGTNWAATTDSLGKFKLEGIPQGSYALQVKSPDPERYLTAQFAMDLSSAGVRMNGPLPVNLNISDVKLVDAPVAEMTLPLSSEYGLLSWWPMDYTAEVGNDTVTTDARGRVGTTKLYGDVELEQGVVGKAIQFNDASQFGVIEDDRGILDSLNEMTLEAFVKIDQLPNAKESYQKNIFGKLGFGSEGDKNVFSLALVNKVCGVEKPALAFFMADGSGKEFSCESAVVSSAAFEKNVWVHVVVTWKDGSAKLYQNSELTGSGDIGVKMLLPSDEPVFFGKEDLDFELDDVRLGAKAITSADVLYRYYQKTGGKL